MPTKNQKTRLIHQAEKENREILVSPRGAMYYLSEEGEKVYLIEQYPKKAKAVFKPRRGAFARSLASQIDPEGQNFNLVSDELK